MKVQWCDVCGGPETDDGREIAGAYLCSRKCFMAMITGAGGDE